MASRMSTGARWGAGGFLGCVGIVSLAAFVHAQEGPVPAPAVAPEHVTLAGIPVTGKSQDEVKKIAADYTQRLLRYPLTIRCEKHVTHVDGAELGGKADLTAAVNAVFTAPAPAGLVSRVIDKFTTPETREVPLPVKFTDSGVRHGLRRFSARVGLEARNARLTKVNGKFHASPPRPGRELDGAGLAAAVEKALADTRLRQGIAAATLDGTTSESEWRKSLSPLDVAAPTREAQPRIGLADLKPITATLASFRTSLGGSSRNRVHNVELACKAVDGTVLLPGDVFSYNDTVGPRVPSAGFREAPVIIRGKLEKGTGGGICQVSSTLYNAVLLADLQIVRRQHHAFPVHYLPAGRDATVVDGAIDFRFKNRLEHAVAIDAKVTGNHVIFQIYGHPDDKREVEIHTSGARRVEATSKTVNDPKLPKGKRVVDEPARSGQRVTVTRVVKKDGEVLRDEVVSHDFYHPFAGVIRVGTAAPKSKPKPTATEHTKDHKDGDNTTSTPAKDTPKPPADGA